MSDGLVLEASGIQKSFFKGKKAIDVLKGVDLKVKEGEMIAIRGASGTGKSTLLHILGTLEPPTKGTVYFGPKRQNLFKYSERALSDFRNKALGFIFQFHHLLPEFTAMENVMMPALIAGHSREVAQKQAARLLEFVGLKARMGHRPSELSGGEQQRVAVARSVILRPQLILADEPTGNLDGENSEIVMDLLGRLNRSTGVAILFVTHDAELANRMHRVLQMKDGRFIN